MKILTVGHPGAGKTFLADKLSEKFGIEKIDIDSLFDKHPSFFLPDRLYRKRLYKLIDRKDNWIIDGYHGSRMPNELWKYADMVVYLNFPEHELKKNVLSRYKIKKANQEFSHWQSTYINNLKNFWQIKYQDDALKKDVARIKNTIRKDAIFIELKSRQEIDKFIASTNQF